MMPRTSNSNAREGSFSGESADVELLCYEGCISRSLEAPSHRHKSISGDEARPCAIRKPSSFRRANSSNFSTGLMKASSAISSSLAVFTLMRLGEIVHLKWLDVDLRRKEIYVRNSATFRVKGGKPRTVPMNGWVFAFLTRKGTAASSFSWVAQGTAWMARGCRGSSSVTSEEVG